MRSLLCRRYGYHLRIERMEETFKRTEKEGLSRSETVKTVLCKDCGTIIVTTNFSEVRIEPGLEKQE